MNTLLGEAATDDAMRVIRRLCKHWSHKYEVRIGEEGGEIALPTARVILRAEPGRLRVTLDNPLEAIPPRMAGVVGEHLQRMSGDAAFVVKWEDGASAITRT